MFERVRNHDLKLLSMFKFYVSIFSLNSYVMQEGLVNNKCECLRAPRDKADRNCGLFRLLLFLVHVFQPSNDFLWYEGLLTSSHAHNIGLNVHYTYIYSGQISRYSWFRCSNSRIELLNSCTMDLLHFILTHIYLQTTLYI